MGNNCRRFLAIAGLLGGTGTAIAPIAVASAQTVASGVPAAKPAETVMVTIDAEKVTLEQVLRSIAQQSGLNLILPDEGVLQTRLVSLHVQKMAAGDAFARVLTGTGLHASIRANTVVLAPADGAAAVDEGGITGHVIDKTTKQPISGAVVSLDDARQGVNTDGTGAFRISNVRAGNHVLHVRKLSYAKRSQTVTVTDDASLSVDIALEQSVNALDQVVVTGTVIPTERKAIPNAITVITAKEIEQRGITHLDQLLRGDVPGEFAQNAGSGSSLGEVYMFSRGASTLGTNFETGTYEGTNPIKTYVDGVELANPLYLTQIDPRSIERIEILSGPQASTIYGSNAINGVMQIFTKRGTSARPQLTLNLQSGWIENNFSSSHTPQHDYNGQVNGVDGGISYNAGGGWNYIGPWTPAKQNTVTSAFGGVRASYNFGIGMTTADVTLRRSQNTNHVHGDPSQTQTVFEERGYFNFPAAAGLNQIYVDGATDQSFGVTLGYTPFAWWSHDFGIGQDELSTGTHDVARNYRTPGDTSFGMSVSQNTRSSLRYSTTARLSLLDAVKATITLGGDGWHSHTFSAYGQSQKLSGPLDGYTSINQRAAHNAGGFVQSQLDVGEHVFLTYGLRVEWNPNYGTEALPNYTPRYGISLTQDFGPVSAKLRGSYGRSTRPPGSSQRGPVKIADLCFSCKADVPIFGNYDYIETNLAILPEVQQGGEGGLELYVDHVGSLVVTRYNQTVDDLIASVFVDSVRSFVQDPYGLCGTYGPQYCGYFYARQYKNLNIGSIRNQGWELQGTTDLGPLTAKGTYSWTKSRTIGVNPLYQSQFSVRDYPQYQHGAAFKDLPEHTWAIGLTYATHRTSATLNVNGIGRFRNGSGANNFYMQHLASSIRLEPDKYNMAGDFWAYNAAYATADLNLSQRVSNAVETVLQVQNLMDHYGTDNGAWYASMGRQVKGGLRIRVP